MLFSRLLWYEYTYNWYELFVLFFATFLLFGPTCISLSKNIILLGKILYYLVICHIIPKFTTGKVRLYRNK